MSKVNANENIIAISLAWWWAYRVSSHSLEPPLKLSECVSSLLLPAAYKKHTLARKHGHRPEPPGPDWLAERATWQQRLARNAQTKRTTQCAPPSRCESVCSPGVVTVARMDGLKLAIIASGSD